MSYTNNSIRYVITGSRGFVGRALIKELLRSDCYYHPLFHDEFQHTIESGNYNVLKEGNYEAVIHLAGRAHVLKEKSDDPVKEFYEANVSYTLEVLNQAKKVGVKRFVFISSVGVYGKYSTERSITEDTGLNPIESYAKSKVEAEELVVDFCRHNNIEYVILRPPLIYGDNPPGNLRRLYRLCQKNLPLPFGLANKKRVMVSLENLISAIILVSYHPNARNQIFNVADDDGISTKELAKFFKISIGKKGIFLPIPLVLFKMLFKVTGRVKIYHQLFGSFELSNDKLKKTVGWRPRGSAKDVLSRVKVQ